MNQSMTQQRTTCLQHDNNNTTADCYVTIRNSNGKTSEDRPVLDFVKSGRKKQNFAASKHGDKKCKTTPQSYVPHSGRTIKAGNLSCSNTMNNSKFKTNSTCNVNNINISDLKTLKICHRFKTSLQKSWKSEWFQSVKFNSSSKSRAIFSSSLYKKVVLRISGYNCISSLNFFSILLMFFLLCFSSPITCTPIPPRNTASPYSENNQELLVPIIENLTNNTDVTEPPEFLTKDVIISIPSSIDDEGEEAENVEFDVKVIKVIREESDSVEGNLRSRSISRRAATRNEHAPATKQRTKKRKSRGKKKSRKGRKRKGSKKNTSSPNILNQFPTLSTDSSNDGKVPRESERLYNKIGNAFHLSVNARKKVVGEDAASQTDYSILRIKAVEENGVVTIFAYKTERYICVNKKGKVRAQKKYTKTRCRFREHYLENKLYAFESLSCKNCYLGMTRKGSMKKANTVRVNLSEAHFLPR